MSDDTNTEIILAALNSVGAAPKAPVRKSFESIVDGAKVVDTAAYTAALDDYASETVLYDQRLKSAARNIKVMTGPDSLISKQLAGMDKALDQNTKEGKIFTGTIVRVQRAEDINPSDKSKRVSVTLYTGTERPTPGLAAGCEKVTTERTDNPDGRSMARDAQLAIGHRVKVFIEMEQTNNPERKSRLLRHIQDLGIHEGFNVEQYHV